MKFRFLLFLICLLFITFLYRLLFKIFILYIHIYEITLVDEQNMIYPGYVPVVFLVVLCTHSSILSNIET